MPGLAKLNDNEMWPYRRNAHIAAFHDRQHASAYNFNEERESRIEIETDDIALPEINAFDVSVRAFRLMRGAGLFQIFTAMLINSDITSGRY